ncbi:uncharacterized protein TNCV_1132321 [Trichonephila clavipes]|nr:uncharacterized protein TNCV_1132321 [Trichonephila clavipes]
MLCSKIQIQIKNLSKNDPSVSSQTTLNVQNDSLNNSINGFSVNSNRNVSSVRLPKIQIDNYFGDPCLWLEFWNKFQNSIDKKEILTKVDKFSYLKSLLGGVAGNVVNGFALSDDNYDNALYSIGREDIVVSAHMSKLLNLYPVKDSNNVTGLRTLYDICKLQIRSLESLNVTSGMYGVTSLLPTGIGDFGGPDTHTCILELQIKRGSVADLETPFLTPEESNPVDRKMKERCFELTRERWPNDSSSHKLLDSKNL